MKILVTITSFLLCLFCNMQAKERVIERPPFTTWSSTSIEFEKVVICDTATIVHIKAFNKPNNWIKIATGSYLKDHNTGQLYPLRQGIGITLDKEFRMPDSGEAEFQLVFPPLPKSTTSVDFSEGDFDGAFKIWGIQLKEKSLPKLSLPEEAVVYKKDKEATLPQPEFLYGKAIFKGQILDYRTDMPSTCQLFLNDPVTRVENPQKITINKDGTFQTKVNVISTTPVTLMLPFGQVDCLIAPEKETTIIINARECCRRQSKLHRREKPYGEAFYFNGYLASIQQEMANNPMQARVDSNYDQLFKDVVGKNANEIKDYALVKYKEISKQIDKASFSKAYKEVLKAELDISVAQVICTTEWIMRHSYCNSHMLNEEQIETYYKTTPIKIPKDHYRVLKEFPGINTPQVLYVSNYSEALRLMQRFESQIKEALGTDKGTLFTTLTTAKIYSSINNFLPLTTEQEEVLNTLPSAAYGEMLKELNTEVLKKIELNKKKTGFTINEIGDVSNEELFDSIISKYRGQVVLVDVWATWCSPCRTANKDILPMKEELKDKDIIYVYLTGETSPSGTWNNMITDIPGEHFRVKADQWSYLMKEFNIGGVPTYFIIDREGNISYRQTGFPGVNTLKEQLIKALEK